MIYKSLSLSYIIIVLHSIFPLMLHGMNLTNNNESNDLAMTVALSYGSTLFCHRDICMLALVDKNFHQIIGQTGDSRKERVTKFIADILPNLTLIPIAWHVNKSGCAVVEHAKVVNKYGRLVEKLRLCYIHLSGNGFVDVHEQECSSFESSISKMPRPYFNKKGDACFYGGRYNNVGSFGQVMEYCLSVAGEQQEFACIAIIEDASGPRPKLIQERLFYLQQFSSLVKAFLNSTIVEEKDGYKLHYLSGVILPPDFKYCNKNSGSSLYRSFEGLSKKVTDPICARYREVSKIAA